MTSTMLFILLSGGSWQWEESGAASDPGAKAGGNTVFVISSQTTALLTKRRVYIYGCVAFIH